MRNSGITRVMPRWIEYVKVHSKTTCLVPSEVYLAPVESEISFCEFVSIQPDETADVTCASQLAVDLRYVKCGGPVKGIHSFVNVKDYSVVGISEIFQSFLRLYEVREKLIEHTYDRAAVMSRSRNGVQAMIK